MKPELIAALINNIAIPELLGWLASLRAEGRVVSEEEALAKLDVDADGAEAFGNGLLDKHPQT